MGAYLEGLVAARRQRLARLQDAAPVTGKVDTPVKRDDFTGIMTRIGTVEARLSDLARERPQRKADKPDHLHPFVAAILGVICRNYAVPLPDIEGPSKCPAIVQAREVAMYLCRKLAPISFEQIARHFGNRNHASVLRAYGKIDRLRMADERLDRKLSELESEISSPRIHGK
ncbi:MAG TPA: helix-turn-helix domain-containing protein [Xanthobacteraceae bacterium]|nr:helix-turn-helix domain-containing protein [Xanthobacteraceae bacterium]